MDTVKVIDASQRRALHAAAKIALGADKGRVALHTVGFGDDGRAFVTDSYVAVRLPFLDGLAEDVAFEAGMIAEASKGAGGGGLRLTVEDETLVLERFDPARFGNLDGFADVIPDSLHRGRFAAGRSQVSYPNVAKLYDEAVGRSESIEAIAFNMSKLVAATKATPAHYGKHVVPTQLRFGGEAKPIVVCADDEPYALVMPMRIR